MTGNLSRRIDMKKMGFLGCVLFSMALTLSSMAVESNVCYNSSFEVV